MAKGGCASVHIVSVLELAVAKRGLTLPSKLVCSLNIFCEPASIPMPHNFFFAWSRNNEDAFAKCQNARVAHERYRSQNQSHHVDINVRSEMAR